ncbi:hypothetical protein D3C75_975150 [compost metagenome]
MLLKLIQQLLGAWFVVDGIRQVIIGDVIPELHHFLPGAVCMVGFLKIFAVLQIRVIRFTVQAHYRIPLPLDIRLRHINSADGLDDQPVHLIPHAN